MPPIKKFRDLTEKEKDAVVWWKAVTTFFSMTSRGLMFATNDDCGDSKYYYRDVPDFHSGFRGAQKSFTKTCDPDSRGYASDIDDGFWDSAGIAVRNLMEIRPYVDAFLFGKNVPSVREFVERASVALWNFEKSVPRKFDGDFSDCYLAFEKAGKNLIRESGFGENVHSAYFGDYSPISDVLEEIVDGSGFRYMFTDEDWNPKKWLKDSGLLKAAGKVS